MYYMDKEKLHIARIGAFLRYGDEGL